MIRKAIKSGDFGLIDIITSEGCIQLLRPFLYRPGIELYQSEVIKVTGVPKTRAITLLKLLAGYGLLKEKVRAGLIFYSAVEGNPASRQLKILIIISQLYDLTRSFADEGIEVYLFGSAAKGEDTYKSDIDLLILADRDKKLADELVDHLKAHMDREVSPVIYTHTGYANLFNKEKVFYESIERYKIKVL